MASIVIKDLAQSLDLDRQAMLAISGGARAGAGSSFVGNRMAPKGRNDFWAPTGVASNTKSGFRTTASLTTLLK
jgi:hypothetical protein